MRLFRAGRRAVAAAFLLCLGNCCAQGQPLSTFDPTIGSALLCHDHVDPAYYNSYLIEFFGRAYKLEGGAYWYKINQSLWTLKVSDVFVSDGSSKLDFIGAIVKAKPLDLARIILNSSGVAYAAINARPFAPLVSSEGGVIVYFGESAKIFCAKERADYRNIR